VHKKGATHLSASERDEIAILKRKGYSLRDIGKALGRSVSTISDEVKRNAVAGSYDAKKAGHKAYVRRKYAKYQGMHIVENSRIKKFVDQSLLDDQSPEAIAGRLRQEKLPGVSKDSIYRYMKSVHGRKIEAQRQKKKQRRLKRSAVHPSLEDRTWIDRRPLYISRRTRIGDAEADFVVSGKGGSGILLVVVDRKLRLAFLELIVSVTIEAVHAAFVRIKERFPELKSLTLDNDILFRRHEELSELLRIPLYFCHPYHSWEKGTVENVNKYIRRDIPKGTDLAKLTASFVAEVEAKLNRRPMKCLKYRTPREMIDEHRRKKKR
jgi:IS30 family transposase